jgi:hypothetical protein
MFVVLLMILAGFPLLVTGTEIIQSEKIEITLKQAERIYRDGILPSGKVVTATAEADIELTGLQVACANCHRRSGLGTNEGNLVMPPVTREFLFQAKTLGRKHRFLYETEGSGTRPEYTMESLKRVIREGIDSSGRELNRLMPRYNLTEQESEALVRYLKTLESSNSPGVSKEEIHFATIVSDQVDESQKKAVLDVLESYFKKKNAGTRLETRRAENAPWHRDWKYESYRKWKLHVWKLTGSSDTWEAQLNQYYTEQPVFAMLSGLAYGSWQPIHDFCEKNHVPCLFPNTDLPVLSESDYYTFYFSKGLFLEANVLAKYLQGERKNESKRKIVQVYRVAGEGQAAAEQFRKKLKLQAGDTLINQVVNIQESINRNFWKKLIRDNQHAIFVLWLNRKDLKALNGLGNDNENIERIFISGTLITNLADVISDSLINIAEVVYPFEQPSEMPMLLYRSNAWFKSQNLLGEHQKLQANTFFVLRAIGRTIMHLRDKFSREYFIELVEHISEKLLVSSVYPRLTLGPGQRYASKGAYILKLSEYNQKKHVPVDRWIIP